MILIRKPVMPPLTKISPLSWTNVEEISAFVEDLSETFKVISENHHTTVSYVKKEQVKRANSDVVDFCGQR